jgi:DNA adenine methylase
MANPIVPWLGGKRRLAKHLLPRFPEHSCYVEVFAGGAALFFMREPSKVEVINDINGELVNLYRVVQHHLEEFIRQFKWSLTSREMFKWLQLTATEPLTDVQRAARFFYLQHNAFGGKVRGQTWGTATTAPAVNLLRIEEQLSAAHMRLAGTYVERLDWSACIAKYDRPHSFFYLDPPYWQTEGYGTDFPFAEYEAMAERLTRLQGKAMVSINDHPDIRRVFVGFHMESFAINYTVAGGHKPAARKELIISTWQPTKGARIGH